MLFHSFIFLFVLIHLPSWLGEFPINNLKGFIIMSFSFTQCLRFTNKCPIPVSEVWLKQMRWWYLCHYGDSESLVAITLVSQKMQKSYLSMKRLAICGPPTSVLNQKSSPGREKCLSVCSIKPFWTRNPVMEGRNAYQYVPQNQRRSEMHVSGRYIYDPSQ